MAENVLKMLVRDNIEAVLSGLAIGGTWMPGFAWYEKTGEKELTLKVRIYQQSVDTGKCLEKVEEILKSMGWTYKMDENLKDAGRVSISDKFKMSRLRKNNSWWWYRSGHGGSKHNIQNNRG